MTGSGVAPLSKIGLLIASYYYLMCQVPATSYLQQCRTQVHAFHHVSSFMSKSKQRTVMKSRTYHHVPVDMMSTSEVDDDTAAADAELITESSDNPADIEANDDHNHFYTTAILKVAYDGTHFSGWTGGNAGDQPSKSKSKQKSRSSSNINNKETPKRRQSRRSRTLQRKGGGWYGSTNNNNKVRTVEETIRMALAKVYGNINPKQIVFEACSRTDAGVHATSLVAQFYCFNEIIIPGPGAIVNSTRMNQYSNSSIPIRPNAPNDESMFVQLPFDSDLSKLVYVLNRMLPPDVRILAASPMPIVEQSTSSTLTKYSIDAFHPTLCTVSKTYVYQFSIGNIQDPLRSRFVWHLDGSSNRAMGMNGKKFDLELAIQAAGLFACNDARDYAAFGSVMRGNEKNRVRNSIGTIWKCDLLHENREQLPSWERANGDAFLGSRLNTDGTSFEPLGISTSLFSPQTFTVVITGSRFMYKQVRNIVGAIVAVACGHNELEDIQKALETGSWGNGPSGNRRICAPARGLKLVEVNYPDDVQFDWKSS